MCAYTFWRRAIAVARYDPNSVLDSRQILCGGRDGRSNEERASDANCFLDLVPKDQRGGYYIQEQDGDHRKISLFKGWWTIMYLVFEMLPSPNPARGRPGRMVAFPQAFGDQGGRHDTNEDEWTNLTSLIKGS